MNILAKAGMFTILKGAEHERLIVVNQEASIEMQPGIYDDIKLEKKIREVDDEDVSMYESLIGRGLEGDLLEKEPETDVLDKETGLLVNAPSDLVIKGVEGGGVKESPEKTKERDSVMEMEHKKKEETEEINEEVWELADVNIESRGDHYLSSLTEEKTQNFEAVESEERKMDEILTEIHDDDHSCAPEGYDDDFLDSPPNLQKSERVRVAESDVQILKKTTVDVVRESKRTESSKSTSKDSDRIGLKTPQEEKIAQTEFDVVSRYALRTPKIDLAPEEQKSETNGQGENVRTLRAQSENPKKAAKTMPVKMPEVEKIRLTQMEAVAQASTEKFWFDRDGREQRFPKASGPLERPPRKRDDPYPRNGHQSCR